MPRRVVVTGLGLVTPLGIGVQKSWQSLCRGESGIRMITRFDTASYRTKFAGEVNEFNPLDFMDKKLARRTSRFIHLALAASRMAMEEARLTINSGNEDRVGVAVATALGGIDSFEKNHRLLLEGAQDRISPFFITSFLANMAPGEIAIQFGAKGPNMCPVTACAAGAQAIGDAFKVIQRGDADAMIVGGVEAPISPVLFAGLGAERVMSTRNDEPHKASRPFDKNRDGFVISEGCGILILEEMESALNRGAEIYAEILGYGFTCDACHITAPDPEGKGASKCMKRALDDAGITIDQIDYINAHGTSTLLNDLAETRAIKNVFQGRSSSLPVSANKSMIGHLWGAAGAVEAIFCILTINHGTIPPTINYATQDPECDLDYVPNVTREAEVKTVLSNSFGFGGANACLILSQFPSQLSS